MIPEPITLTTDVDIFLLLLIGIDRCVHSCTDVR
jgi:hypothetical protein